MTANITENRRLGRVAVLAGGPSNEREISLRSGRAVYDALRAKGLDAVLLDIRAGIEDALKGDRMDVAFIALHGRFGEDGTVQDLLEQAGIPYTGSGVAASRLAMDKIASKKRFIEENIATPDYLYLAEKDRNVSDILPFEFPVVVKPQYEGSSIGLSIVREAADLTRAIEDAFSYGGGILIERYIKGRELTVGILNDDALPIVEIITRENVYDYKAKYDDPGTKYIVPAEIEDKLAARIQKLAQRAHKALGCRFFSRVDMMMDDKSNLFVLEVNTIPGMTERSLLPKAAEASGIGFSDLCFMMMMDASERALRQKQPVF